MSAYMVYSKLSTKTLKLVVELGKTPDDADLKKELFDIKKKMEALREKYPKIHMIEALRNSF